MAEECTVVRFTRDSSTARIETLKNDSPDKFQEQNTFNIFYVICIALSIITYVVDLALACALLYFYSVGKHGVEFALTLTFLLVPALFMTTISLRWYIVDHDDPSVGKTSLTQWIIRMFFLLLQVAPLLRYIDTMIYGLKSRIYKASGRDQFQTTWYRRMLDEDTNGALLRLFHCFLHSAPQAVIQLMFLLQNIATPNIDRVYKVDVAVIQAWTVFAALISIAWSLTTYHRSVRYARDDKDKVTSGGTLVAFCWHFFSAVSRVLALSMLASIYPAWMGCVCALHWGVSAFWLALGHHQTAPCSNRCEELLLSTALGLAYVLAFLTPRDGPTRYQYLAYYLVCFMENTGALVVWCVSNNSLQNLFLYYGTPAAQLTCFLLSLVCLLLYYRYCHPSTASHSKILEITDPSMLDMEKPGYSKSFSQRTYS